MKKEKRGGRRENAGRPPQKIKRRRLQITLPPNIIEIIKASGERPSDIIETSLKSTLGIINDPEFDSRFTFTYNLIEKIRWGTPDEKDDLAYWLDRWLGQ